MRQKRVTFINERGVELAGTLDLPEDEHPVAYALFAHCFTCTRNFTAAINISRALAQRRIATLRFDFTGLGGSSGEFVESTFSSDVRDIVSAARFLEEEFAAPRILIGHSLGGTAILIAAPEIPSAVAVATLGAPFHPRHVVELFGNSREKIHESGEATVTLAGRSFTIRKSFIDDLEEQNPLERIKELRAALMIMHSPRDRIVSIENATDIYRAARHPKNFISLEPADHLLSRKEDSLYAGDMIAAWSMRYLETTPEAPLLPEVIDNRVTSRTAGDGFRTDLFVNGHSLVADEPERFGGTNQGPSPYDYLQAALGACTGMTLQMYAKRKEWPLQAVVVRLRHRKIHAKDCAHCQEKNARIDHFERELEIIGPLDDDQKLRLLEIADKCPVHRTLESEVWIETKVRQEEEEAGS